MARTTNGRLYTRGKKKYYYLQYYVDKKQFRVALKDDNGNSITLKSKAQHAANKILLPVTAKSESDRWRLVVNELNEAKQKGQNANADLLNNQAVIKSGWELFMSCPKRPASCKRYKINEIPRKSTAGNYKGYYDRFAAWMNDNHPKVLLLVDVSEDIANQFMEFVQQNFSNGTYNKYRHFFIMFYDVLVSCDKITIAKNPFNEIDRAMATYNSKKPLTIQQIADLIDQASGDMRMLIALGYFTGLRQGDCCTLQWREIDLIRGIIERIPRKIEHTVKDQNQALVKIGIPRYLFQMLNEIPEDQRTGYLLPTMAKTYLADQEYKISLNVIKHFHLCGIETIKPGTGRGTGKRAVVEIGFHSLRYSYISHNAEAGTPAAVIQKNAGHSNPAMTEHYTRISDDAAVKYAGALQLPSGDDIMETTKRETLLNMISELPDEFIDQVIDFVSQLQQA